MLRVLLMHQSYDISVNVQLVKVDGDWATVDSSNPGQNNATCFVLLIRKQVLKVLLTDAL